MKNTLDIMRVLVVIFILFFMPVILHAQGGFDDNVTDNPVPFDGGVSLLVAAGIGYGLKKANDKKRAQREINENK